jgi:thiol-disulfide isomerase/thioredoxin
MTPGAARWSPQAVRIGHWVPPVLLLVLLHGCGAPGSRGKPAAGADPQVQPASVDQLLAVVREPGARVVLLNVWATWCVPCREEFPDLLRIEREYRQRGLRLVLVSGDFDSELPAVKRFLADHEVGFLTYLKQGADMPFIDGLDARWSGALPATLLYDAAGRRIWFHEGKVSYDTLKTRIAALLDTPPAPAP